jgi:hypothetical protein
VIAMTFFAALVVGAILSLVPIGHPPAGHHVTA